MGGNVALPNWLPLPRMATASSGSSSALTWTMSPSWVTTSHSTMLWNKCQQHEPSESGSAYISRKAILS